MPPGGAESPPAAFAPRPGSPEGAAPPTMNFVRILPNLIVTVLSNPVRAKDRVLRALVRDIIDGRAQSVLVVTALHAGLTYLGFWALGEAALVSSWVQFAYFYITTGSTVGYGDLSPQTQGGMLFAFAFVMPGAIAIFAYILTKLLASLALFVRTFMSGLGNFESAEDHVVIVGYVRGETERLLAETEQERAGRETVIVSTEQTLPLPHHLSRVHTNALADHADLKRAGVAGARTIVVMGRSDDETMSACLALGAMETRAHMVAFFRDAEKAKLVQPHCPRFEYVVSTSVQQLSRAIVDPGASQVFAHLASTKVGATLQSIDYEGEPTVVSELMSLFLSHGATLIGYRADEEKKPTLSLQPDTRIGREHTLFYISPNRLPDDLFGGAGR